MKEIQQLDWDTISAQLNSKGFSHISNVLSEEECKHLSSLYKEDSIYRTTINMQRYRFGQGEYKYFKYPLPSMIQTLR
jgi:hypothetical protein